MFHDSGVKLPRYVGTKTPEQVAAAVAKAIATGRLEVDVAPLGLRVGTALAGLAPAAIGGGPAPARRARGLRRDRPRPDRQALSPWP